MEPYIGDIKIFAGNFAPVGWAFCQGQLLSIASNTALFSILGTYYGGDGRTTFALPDLRGRAPLHQGAGPGLTPRALGESGGEAAVTLLTAEMPAHSHTVNCQAKAGDNASPSGAVWANTGGRSGPPLYSQKLDTPMNPRAVGIQGANSPHNNMQPYLSVNFIIALEGAFPPRG